VRAGSLKEALARVRHRYGAEARVLESRTVALRQSDGLGQEKAVEVVVDPGGSSGSFAAPKPQSAPPAAALEREVTEVITSEVERIERLVETICGSRTAQKFTEASWQDYPLTACLIGAGASRSAVNRFATGFEVDPAFAEKSFPAAVRHLTDLVRTGGDDWREFAGCHVFLGDSGAGKSDLVLGTAASLKAKGKNPLVLALLPRHGGEVRRLQLEAAEHSYDAAIIQNKSQISQCLDNLDSYDVVLIDTPSLFGRDFAEAIDLQQVVSQNESFHRHLVVPLPADLREKGEVWQAARLWNCDWLALTHLDGSARPGKILDILGRVSLPFSLLSCGPWPESAPQIARSPALVQLILGENPADQVAQARA
jgi:flagellar biosynthesis GTPase FlhF